MPYTQNWGISRNAFQSPLNNDEVDTDPNADKSIIDQNNENARSESELKWGYMGEDGKWVDGTEYTDSKSEFNTEGAGANKSETTDVFGLTKEDHDKGTESYETKKSLAMLQGGDEWANSSYNTQSKKGYDDQGRVMTLHEGDKITRDGEDITESHNRKLRGEMSTEDQLDNTQAALGVGGFAPGYGAISDGTNALLSGGRGMASIFGAGDKGPGHHFKNMFKNAFYAIPALGDAAAFSKVQKYGKQFNDYHRGTNLVTKNYSKSNKWAQDIIGAAKNWETKGQNILRGFSNWVVNKNKYNKIGSNLAAFFGKDSKIAEIIGGMTSSKLVTGKTGGAIDTINTAVPLVSGEISNSLASLSPPSSSSFGIGQLAGKGIENKIKDKKDKNYYIAP